MHAVARLVLDGHGGERGGVLRLHVGEEGDLRSEEATVAKGVVSPRGENALIGDHRTRVHVDADEARAHRHRDGECGQRVGAQGVDAERQRDGAADLGRHRGHGGHARRVHAPGREGNVTEVFDEEGVDAAVREGLRIGEGGPRDIVHRAGPARAAG